MSSKADGGGAAGGCRIVHGEAAETLSRMPSESVQCVCTDPPYGVMVARQEWDRSLPDGRAWRECVRVMEPGAFAFVLCSPRQDVSSRMIASLEGAGLDMSFPPVLWTYATGFSTAKSAAQIARRFGRRRGGAAAATGGPDADGSYLGYVPRPAVELALVGMRPARNGAPLIDQYEENGLGVTHLDDCRVPYAGDADRKKMIAGYYVPADGRPLPPGSALSRDGKKIRIAGKADERGRFPTNLLCSGGALDDGRPHGSARGTYSRYFDLDAWADAHLTPAITAAPKPGRAEREGGLGHGRVEPRPIAVAGPRGGKNSPEETPYNRNARARLNNHPAVKPIALFAYLMHLGSRAGDTVLDPFAGTGTAALAAAMTGRRCVAIERSERYAAIAVERLQRHAMSARMEAFA